MRFIDLAELRNNPRRAGQFARAANVLTEHPDAVLIEVSDEYTGRRFGLADCRRGMCKKVGRSTYRYQLWTSWASQDTRIQARYA